MNWDVTRKVKNIRQLIPKIAGQIYLQNRQEVCVCAPKGGGDLGGTS